MNKPELLAPAGGEACVYAAVQSGADSVYLGLKNFGARSFAENFDREALHRVIEYCHLRGVKVYVTLNTLTADVEINEVLENACLCANEGADGVIVQDMGLISLIREHYPELPVHVSTQATVMNSSAMAMAEKLGAIRAVVARELSFEEICSITGKSAIETEIFVHGAQCYSYSGQCLMSSIYGGRSGNRGKCAGPCRLPYTLEKNGKTVDRGYLLSPVDMCLGLNTDKVLKTGAHCLKIEGRMKGPEYVAACCEEYRNALDCGENISEEKLENLKNIFSRGGFTAGLFEGGENLIKKQSSNDDAYENQQKEILDYYRNKVKSNSRRVPVKFYFKAISGEYPQLTMEAFGESFKATGEKTVAEATSAPLDEERIRKQLEKLGDSPFVATEIKVFTSGNIFMPMGEINALRRLVVAMAEENVLKNNLRSYNPVKLKRELPPKALARTFTAYATTEEQALALTGFEEISTIYLPARLYKQGADSRVVPSFPAIVREKHLKEYTEIMDNLAKQGVGKIQVNEWGCLYEAQKRGFEICVGGDMNVFNSHTVKALEKMGVSGTTLSWEMLLKQAGAVCGKGLELIVYGRPPLMKTANCPVRGRGECGKNPAEYSLTDRKGEKIPVVCNCSDCTAYLFNSKPVYMADKLSEIPSNISGMCLYFTVESGEETRRIVKNYLEENAPEGEFTRGHFFRGVL